LDRAKRRKLSHDGEHHGYRGEHGDNEQHRAAFLLQARLPLDAFDLASEHHDPDEKNVKPPRNIPRNQEARNALLNAHEHRGELPNSNTDDHGDDEPDVSKQVLIQSMTPLARFWLLRRRRFLAVRHGKPMGDLHSPVNCAARPRRTL
jgi:hypothetical protein